MKTITTILKFLVKNWIIIFCLLFAIIKIVNFGENNKPEIIFLNVGQGDAALIQQGSFQILIDTGPDASILYELPKYMPANDYTIEFVFLTHSHDDHIQGLFSLLGRYDIKNIVYQKQCFKSPDWNYIEGKYSNVLRDIDAPITLSYQDIKLTTIYPFKINCHEDVNQDSLVMKVKIYDTNILFMGDAGMEAEDYLLSNGMLSQTDILKVGHHCSRSATSEMFLKKVFPSISICDCGEGNSFGHPHSETLKTLEKFNVQYLITYEKGNIVFKFKKP